MKATYDPASDTLTLELKPGPVAKSDEHNPGVLPDYDAADDLMGIEIFDASRRVTEARSMQFKVAQAPFTLQLRDDQQRSLDAFQEHLCRVDTLKKETALHYYCSAGT